MHFQPRNEGDVQIWGSNGVVAINVQGMTLDVLSGYLSMMSREVGGGRRNARKVMVRTPQPDDTGLGKGSWFILVPPQRGRRRQQPAQQS